MIEKEATMTYQEQNSQAPPRRLYRSQVNRMIAGVCGGLGEFMNVDPVIVRIAFILLTIFGGIGFLLYLIGIIIIPKNPNQQAVAEAKNKSDTSAFWGWLLIILGFLFLVPQFTFLPEINLWELPWVTIWGIIFIGFGVFLVLKKPVQDQAAGTDKTPAQAAPSETETETNQAQDQPRQTQAKTLYRSRKERMVAGVCGGLAEYFSIDPTVVRLIFVLLTLFSKGFGIVAYIILILAVPEEK
jgi:phage shock protein PspC (stress-responsive transcriptional regulator)